MSVTLDQIYEEVKTTREILTGNGDPDKGLIVRHVRLEERQENFKDDVSDIKQDIGDFRDEFKEYAKTMTNRRSNPNAKILGVVPKRVVENVWMWVVRGTIFTVISGLSWIGCNNEAISKLMDLIK